MEYTVKPLSNMSGGSSGGNSGGGYPVTVNEFDEEGYATKITIKGLEKIPDFGFSGYKYNSMECFSVVVKKLETVVLGSDVKTIGKGAFYNNSSIKTINIDNITYIDQYAFSGCTNLNISKFPEGVSGSLVWSVFNSSGVSFKTLPNITLLGYSVLSKCNNLTQLSMPKVEYLSAQGTSSGAIRECKNLKAVWFGANLKNIADYTFGGCTAMKRIFIDKPRAQVEAMSGYSIAWAEYNNITFSFTTDVIVCNDDEGFMTQEEFDAIDWATYEFE